MARIIVDRINLSNPKEIIATAIALNRTAVVKNLSKKGYSVSGYSDEKLTNFLLGLSKKYNIVPIINVPVYDEDFLDQIRSTYISNRNGNPSPTTGELMGKGVWEILYNIAIGIGGAFGLGGGNEIENPLPPVPPAETPQWVTALYWFGGSILLITLIYVVAKVTKK